MNRLSLSTLKGHPASAARPVSHLTRSGLRARHASPLPVSGPVVPQHRAFQAFAQRLAPLQCCPGPAATPLMAASPLPLVRCLLCSPRAGPFSAYWFSGSWTSPGDPGQLTLPVSF